MNHLRTRSLALLLPACLLLALSGPAIPADAKDDTIHLFNGKDLTHFYTYLKAHGKNADPDKVFTVHDGMLHISGNGLGGLVTEKEYGNYHLITEFKWGAKTWPPREDKGRDSGILLHCTGDDGAVAGAWMEAIECQMMEGATGDLILVGGKTRPSITAQAVQQEVGEGKGLHKEYYYKPGSPPVTLASGRFNWFARDPLWKDVKDFRGQKDIERPVGEWNKLECICKGNTITLVLNGVTVNAGTDASVSKGKLLIQAEGAELFFRKIDLKPLKK
jgi:3-keto-disaccharide hydrolase